jgi:bifunctional autolysin
MNNCEYITKTNNTCSIKAKKDYNINNKYYCKKHYDLVIKQNNIKYCDYISKNNNKCSTKAKNEYIINNNYYCKKHYDLFNNKKESIPKKESTNNKKSHPKKESTNKKESTPKKESTNKKESTPKKESSNKLNSEEKLLYKKLQKEVIDIKSQIISHKNKNDLKKQIFKLLLQVHPDKCKLSSINSTHLTQELTHILQTIKSL